MRRWLNLWLNPWLKLRVKKNCLGGWERVTVSLTDHRLQDERQPLPLAPGLQFITITALLQHFRVETEA